MSIRLPSSASKTRDLFDMTHLAESAQNMAALPTRRDLPRIAREGFTDKAVRAIHVFVARADGELWLVRLGPKGGKRRVFNFGNPLTAQ